MIPCNGSITYCGNAVIYNFVNLELIIKGLLRNNNNMQSTTTNNNKGRDNQVHHGVLLDTKEHFDLFRGNVLDNEAGRDGANASVTRNDDIMDNMSGFSPLSPAGPAGSSPLA